MDLKGLLKAVVLVCSISACCGGRGLSIKAVDANYVYKYNHTLAKALVEFASAVYTSDLTALFEWTCTRCGGLTEGFEVVDVIVDVRNCLQAYVGFAENLNAIVVVFRGTQENSIQNWLEDLLWKQLDVDYPGMPDAMVHRGFYSAYYNTTMRRATVNAVKRARKAYGQHIPVMVTGHSMGGAMASFCALDLAVNYEVQDVRLMTFGQPRIGNAAFSSYFSERVPNAFRITNKNDIVPHLPPYYPFFRQKTYHHFPREVWIHEVALESLVYLEEKLCDSSGEDPSCSRSVSGNSVQDHIHYLGVNMHAESWSSCRIVTDSDHLVHGGDDDDDDDASIILSKELPALSLGQ